MNSILHDVFSRGQVESGLYVKQSGQLTNFAIKRQELATSLSSNCITSRLKLVNDETLSHRARIIISNLCSYAPTPISKTYVHMHQCQ